MVFLETVLSFVFFKMCQYNVGICVVFPDHIFTRHILLLLCLLQQLVPWLAVTFRGGVAANAV